MEFEQKSLSQHCMCVNFNTKFTTNFLRRTKWANQLLITFRIADMSCWTRGGSDDDDSIGDSNRRSSRSSERASFTAAKVKILPYSIIIVLINSLLRFIINVMLLYMCCADLMDCLYVRRGGTRELKNYPSRRP